LTLITDQLITNRFYQSRITNHQSLSRGLQVRHTLRLLLKSPGFAITAVLILGFGIGANTTIFSLIDAVILNALPYPQPDRLVRIHQPEGNTNYWAQVDYPDYLDIKARQHSLEDLAVQYWWFLDFAGQGNPQRFTAIFASPGLFSLSKLPFVLGRPFTEDEDKQNGPLVVVLSEALWKSHFNSDPNIIGKSLRLSGQSFEVIGVCPRQIEDVSTPAGDVTYVPVHVSDPSGNDFQKRDEHYLSLFGRLKPGVTLGEAQAELEIIQQNLVKQYSVSNTGYGIKVVPVQENMVSSYSGVVWLLGGAVGCLLLISCANVANLLFARGLTRRKEMLIRATLGASRASLLRQLFSETACLAVLGGLTGLLLAVWWIGLMKAISPDYLYRFGEVKLDTRALLFVFAVTALVSLLSGLLPALNLSGLSARLQDQGGRAGTTSRQRQRTQSALVAGQVALACLLLVGGGLFIRSFQNMQSLPLGFNPHHLLTADITVTNQSYANDQAKIGKLFEAVLEKARALPGVTEAAMNQDMPFQWGFGELNAPFHIPGQPAAEPGKEPTFCSQDISSGYFQTMEIPLLSGRDFNSSDRLETQHVIIVDNAFAQHFFPNQNPIGKQIEYLWANNDGQKTWTIVGVVQNSRHNSPDHPLAPYQVFLPYSQRDNLYRGLLLLRSEGDPTRLGSAVQRIVREVDPDQSVTQMMTLDDLITNRSWTRELGVSLVSIFSAAALFLSAVGLYGVLVYSVSQRTREIGVRIALGAQVTNILELVLWRGLKLVIIGSVAGMILALILVRFIDSILYGVSGGDPLTLATAVLILALAAAIACLLPALRAIRVSPITALRE
jgi:putative ABC transport system permease protein